MPFPTQEFDLRTIYLSPWLKNAWIIDPTAQATLTAYIDSMIEYLTELL